MSLEQNVLSHQHVADKYKEVLAAYSMTVRDQVVRCDSTAGVFDLLLPNVSEAKGRFYSITLRATTGTAVTLKDNGDSEGWADFTLDTDDDNVLCYSDGLKWYVLADIA